ncbi:uncharacterized protein LOC111892277 [Lactuca sativa]|uniref:uncharacterized protein LOC111892277 n=1 Tax=Lactuca sativa TaxID=4236 RepID=UPI000CBE8CA4|nr:uncharacterized protein LOC111892277 [Lactuca sativa]
MQSRLAVSKLNRILMPTPKSKYQTIHPRLFSSSSSSGKNMEDAMTQGVDTEGETGDAKPDNHDDNIIPTREDHRYMRPKTVPPNLSASKLETPGVNTPFDPHVQQKRTKAELSFGCAGLDGSPWPNENDHKGTERKEQEQEKDDKHYFEHHKASPLSEIEIADSRKPLTRVIHGTGTAGGYFGDEQVMTWTPEQLDTAEQSLLRASQIFRESAARGIPELPHSRRLRQLRGEDI